jgi:hypothetical protein
MANPYIGTSHIFWLEQLYKQKENQRTGGTIPTKAFEELKVLDCVEGTPALAQITGHGAGELLSLRAEQAEADKRAKKAKRKKGKRR